MLLVVWIVVICLVDQRWKIPSKDYGCEISGYTTDRMPEQAESEVANTFFSCFRTTRPSLRSQ
jgi:hypothetical protein